MNWAHILTGIIDTAIFSLVGIVMMGLGIILVVFLCPFSVKKEIEDDQNTALGIIIGAIIIGISIIVAGVVTSPSQMPDLKHRPHIEQKAETKTDEKTE